MLQRKYRLSSRNAVRRASRYGKQARYAEFSVRHIDSRYNHPRFAVVVSKKVDKRAVVRNKIKRTIIEAYRQNILAQTKTSSDIVIFVHNPKAIDKSPQQLVSDIKNLFKKANIL